MVGQAIDRRHRARKASWPRRGNPLIETALGPDLFRLGALVYRGDLFGVASGNSRGYGGSLKLEIAF